MIYKIYNKIIKKVLATYNKVKIYSYLLCIKYKINKNKSTVFLLQTPTHGNIGDHAITIAELYFLDKNIDKNKHQVIEVNQSVHYYFMKYIKVRPWDIILLHGGGNFGDEYIREENIRRSVFSKYSNNKIIQFPQTIFYKNCDNNNFSTTKGLVNSCKDLTLIAREQVSFNMMKEYYNTANILLTPDIVLSYNKIDDTIKRKGALMIMRTDSEKILENNDFTFIKNVLSNNYQEVTISDMQFGADIFGARKRIKVLNDKFKQFQKAEIVVTDRLHGMVFAAITGTPCIAFSNYNQKVSGTYEWISGLNYIYFLKNTSEFEESLNEIRNIEKKSIFEPEKYDTYFNQIIDAITK